MKKKLEYRTRSDNPDDIQRRGLSLRLDAGGRPASLDEKARSVEVVAATEEPVKTYDWGGLGRVDEILPMSRMKMPDGAHVRLLDTHDRWTTESVIGSARNLRVQGNELLACAVFSEVGRAVDAFAKVREGHLTDVSIGYTAEYQRIPKDSFAEIDGRKYEGPALVAISWEPKELSFCPVGADRNAKARAVANNRETEESVMDEKMRKFLESRGLAADATEDQARAFLEKLEVRSEPEPKPAPEAAATAGETSPPVDVEAEVRKAVLAEQGRALEIRALCEKFNCADQADAMIREDKTVDQARRAVLEIIGARDQAAGSPNFRAEQGKTDQEKFRAAGTDSILMRAGLAPEKPAAGAEDLQVFTLRELARECLVRAGRSVPKNVMEMIGRAMTTSDFPYILADSANKALFAGYDQAEETWDIWCGNGSVSDFKTHSMPRASETDDLDEIPEHGEYKYGKRTEAKEEYYIVTYGKLFAITRQAVINDDLTALTDTPKKHGEAAKRKIGDVAYAVPTANAAMGDGIALFHGSHSNLLSGSAMDVTNLGLAIKAMKLQKDLQGLSTLNIRPRFFIAPVALEGSSEQFFNTIEIGGVSNQPNLNNPYAGKYFTRVYDPRLDTDDANAWYLAGVAGKTVTVFFLNGIQKPYMETKQGWHVDGVEYKVRIDAGAKAVDWRAMTKNPGPS